MKQVIVAAFAITIAALLLAFQFHSHADGPQNVATLSPHVSSRFPHFRSGRSQNDASQPIQKRTHVSKHTVWSDEASSAYLRRSSVPFLERMSRNLSMRVTMVERELRRHRTNVVPLHDCVAAFYGVRVRPLTGLELLIPRDVVKRENTLRFCSITSTTASQFTFPLADAPKDSETGDLESSMVSIGILERPQHAMQFLFSLLGITAMQDTYGFDIHKDIAIVSIVTYGKFASWFDVSRTDVYPHLELLQVLSKVGVAVVNQRKTFDNLDMVVPSDDARAPWVKWNMSNCIQRPAPPSFPWNTRVGVFGSLPARVLHYKKQERRRHGIDTVHFTNFKWRLFDYFQLVEEKNARKRYVVVVTRLKQKRRLILNHDEIVTMLGSLGPGFQPVVVDWEGMSTKDMLQIAVNANAVIGMHGNGHVWDCFMPEGSLMVEFSSDIALRNEVASGRNRRNVGNLAGLCPIVSHSFRCRGVENEYSRSSPPSRTWKEVDIMVSDLQLRRLKEILLEYQQELLSRDSPFVVHPPVKK